MILGVNSVILIGNAGHTPKLAETRYGVSYARLFLATTTALKKNKGEGRNFHTVWHDCRFYAGVAESLCGRVKKGDILYVAGHLDMIRDKNPTANKGYYYVQGKFFTLISRDGVQMDSGDYPTAELEGPVGEVDYNRSDIPPPRGGSEGPVERPDFV